MKKLVGGLLAVGSVLAWEADAHACGGCFNRPETPTVVTDHHMIFSISKFESTLYDQIQYTGAPESFGWVLPYSGEIRVGVSSDVLFRTIDNLTQTQVLPPPQNCPARPANCPVPDFASAGAAPPADVNVLRREVVGPYDTAQLQASDPAALEKWLSANGFNLPDAVKPVVAAYVGEKFNFLALKLVPGQGVQAMKPVRVTTKGSNVALPLRMVAAGTGATVGITLWIVAEGRYQPANFDMFTIASEDLAWDWTQNKSNYIDVRTQKNAAANGRAWELESVSQADRNSILQTVNQGGPFTGFGGGAVPYNPPDADGGAKTNTAGYAADGQKTADDVRDDDFATLFGNLPPGSEKITRIRADLDHAALDRDLTLQASTDQSLVNRVRQVTKELNEPLCPVYDGCESTTTAPRSQAIARTNENNDDGCSTTTTKRPSATWLALGLGVLGFALARRKKKTT
jgi:MYXO-CTERM domain-containing protein